ncbi:tRNA (adenosine(37)-N6)-threonylcarbamoyltransferase complex ATPase subunit type 1 TsaE, partial [Candidatus Sarmatiella mevalonica]|uniref:tRNA (adenosine(37)-N6)-threonylcarbamoyltransferase complex ATPase subunit type 1 TsaE n=1 Tax=Candidatus Sarmatiella mevalonica TaxID=2770581 RepID=UPI001920EEB6
MKRIVKQEDMHRVAKYLVNNHQSPCLILLDGEMGSGKTFLCQEIIKLMIPDVIVTSPTFNLLQIY